jgi:2-polyprenyl-3-methyl-5-hydroxy-6-metoxy-1,4-benzoquinol methylase
MSWAANQRLSAANQSFFNLLLSDLNLLALLLLALVCLAQPAASDTAIWNDFTSWLQRQQPNSKPGELIRLYRENLLKQGLSPDETGRRMSVVSDSIFTRRKGVEALWDKVFAGNDPIFIQTPSAIVMSAIEGRKPGKALDIGMGQGRNSVYLAAQGWDVTGFDPSQEGVRIAQANAAKAGVKFRTLVARDDEFDYGSSQWDLIVITYVRDLTGSDAAIFLRALKPGGIVVYENGADTGNQVLRAFLGFRIIRFEDVETTAEWNPDRKTHLQRLIAQRPSQNP